MKIKPTKCKRTFASNYTSDRGLIFAIYKEHKNSAEKTRPELKMSLNLNREFSKEEIKMLENTLNFFKQL